MPSGRRTSSAASHFLNLPFLILLLSLIAFLLFFLLVFPSFLFFSSSDHRLRPKIAVRKSWDSLNVFLVLFAILCGVFARRNDDDSAPGGLDGSAANRSVKVENGGNSGSSSNWFDQFSSPTPASGGMRRMKRSSSSYPDLRQESLFDCSGDHRSRFFDDFELHRYRSSDPDSSSDFFNHPRQRTVIEESVVKEIPVDTYEIRSTPPPREQPPASPAPPPPPPPPPPPVERNNHRQKRTYRTVSRQEKIEKSDDNDEFVNTRNQPSTPPPPPPPPPRPAPTPPVLKATRSERNHRQSDRKKVNATKEIKMALISLYHQSKRKKKLKTRNPYDESLDSRNESPSFTVPPPPPPPPPPPSVFQNFFKKGSKNKRIHSFSSAPMPPPPPPPPRPSLSSSKRWSKRKSQVPPPPPVPPPPAPPTPPRVYSRWRNSSAAGRPPLPTRINNVNQENAYVNSGGQSPLIPMPPPPPPPPFRVPGFKFRLKGDYVKIRSANSSRCSSPELEDAENKSTERVNMMDGRDASIGSVFCPSPDVNVKADTFIARLRGEWRLENQGQKHYGP